MPIELTTGQWVSLVCGVAFGLIGVNALRRNRRWFALVCGLIFAQCAVSLVVPHPSGFMRYVSLPFGITVLLILRRVTDEAQAARTGSARESQL